MGQATKTYWTTAALHAAGLIGSFEVDYSSDRIRGNGMIGPYFMVLKRNMLVGVPLSDLDRAYHPFDLDNIRRMRTGFVGKGGQYRNQFRIKHQFTGEFSIVQASFTVRVDQFGIPISAEGAMFDVTATVRQDPPGPYDDLLNIAGHLNEAKRLADQNAMARLSSKIDVAFELAADIGVNRILE